MNIGLLAPVPCEHLESALKTCKVHGRVAFGSNNASVFVNPDGTPRLDSGAPVLIYASRYVPGKHKFFIPGPPKASFTATFVRWLCANSKGKHRNDELRPITTATDGPAIGYWEVSDLKRRGSAGYISMDTLRTPGSKANLRTSFIPRGPILVVIPDL